jgi:hypothetical protein
MPRRVEDGEIRIAMGTEAQFFRCRVRYERFATHVRFDIRSVEDPGRLPCTCMLRDFNERS